MRKKFRIQFADGATLEMGERTLVVGVLNVTPDSFSDGGRHFDSGRAIDWAMQMERDGADVIEIGGESTRPGARHVPAEEELGRVMPVLEALAPRLKVPISVDTYKADVARVCLGAGARLINDVSALRFDPALADTVAEAGAVLVLMHMRGEPSTMQKIPPSPDIFAEIARDFQTAIEEAVDRNVPREHIILDPGVGFGKTLEQNLAILNRLERFDPFDLPLMVGTSRKSFIGRITGKAESDRIFGTAASVAVAIARGAHFIRVHDVKEMVEVARITDAIISQ